MKSTAAQRKLVIVLFILVLITFTLAQRDSKRLDRLYTWMIEKTGNATAVQNEAPVSPSAN
jgi:hypothetical protein